MDGTRSSIIPLLAGGCRWVVDTQEIDDATDESLRERWARSTLLGADEDTLVLDEAEHRIALRTGPLAAPGEPDGGPDGEEGLVQVAVLAPEHLPYDLSRAITRACIERLVGRALLLHSAALADDLGRCVVLTAPSGGGKSTAATVLGRRLGYVTDELVVVTEALALAPYPKPPSVVVDPDHPTRKDEPSPDDIGLRPTPARPRLACLLTLRRDETTEHAEIVPVPLADQLVAVIPETSSLWALPDPLDRLARVLVRGGGPAELRYREIAQAADLVAAHLATAPDGDPAVSWRHHPAPPDRRITTSETDEVPPADQSPGADRAARDSSGRDAGTARWRRAPWTDAVETDGRIVLLRGSQVAVLSGVGTTVWREAREPREHVALLELVVGELGPHPEADRLVGEAVAQLVDEDILERC